MCVDTCIEPFPLTALASHRPHTTPPTHRSSSFRPGRAGDVIKKKSETRELRGTLVEHLRTITGTKRLVLLNVQSLICRNNQLDTCFFCCNTVAVFRANSRGSIFQTFCGALAGAHLAGAWHMRHRESKLRLRARKRAYFRGRRWPGARAIVPYVPYR